jgi:hypothetical protein
MQTPVGGTRKIPIPEISRFHGVVIEMYEDDHAPLHGHAYYFVFNRLNGKLNKTNL